MRKGRRRGGKNMSFLKQRRPKLSGAGGMYGVGQPGRIKGLDEKQILADGVWDSADWQEEELLGSAGWVRPGLPAGRWRLEWADGPPADGCSLRPSSWWQRACEATANH